MCEPISATTLTIAGVAMSAATTIGTTIMSYMAQQDQANQQQKYNDEMTQAINQDRINKYDQAQEQQVYKNTDASNQTYEESLRTRAAIATAMTSAGENGVAGNSVAALANSYYGSQARYDSDVEYNRLSDDNQIQLEEQGFDAQAQSEQAQLRPAVYPSPLGAALRIGGSIGSSYLDYSAAQKAGANSKRIAPDDGAA